MQTPRDSLGRSFRKLRVSLTDACNFACAYCVADGARLRPLPGLDAAGLARCAALVHKVCDLRSLRVTGGEPLIAPALDGFLRKVADLGVADLSLTTNGHLLREKLPLLRETGVRRVNISIDSLDPEGFRQITRGGSLDEVLAGIEAARDAGLGIKLNAVPMRGVNDDQVLPLVEFGLRHGIEVRFIELMRMGHLQDSADFERRVFPLAEILDCIATRYRLREVSVPESSTARCWEVDGGGRVGVIPNVSAPFCGGCDRLRLTAQGRLYGCISNARFEDMSPLLRMSDDMATVRLGELLGRALADKQPVRFSGMIATMRALGG